MFNYHTIETAPEKSKAILEQSQKSFGMIPNLHAIMAESPELLHSYGILHQAVMNSSFDNDEKTVVWQTINVEHECHYCVPAHTAIAKTMGVSDEISNALRDNKALPNHKLEVLRTFTLAVVRNRGNVTEEEANTFLDNGYTQQNILEVILVISQKVISNYTNHIVNTQVDKAFEPFIWKPQYETHSVWW